MVRPFLLLFTLTLGVFVSCNDNDTTPQDTRTLLSGTDAFGKTWSISQIEVELGTITPHPCVTDNFITYYPDGRYEIGEGREKCNPNDPRSVEGFWELTTSESRLVVQVDDSTQVWVIETLSQTQHRISSAFAEGNRIYSLRAL